MLLSDAIVKPTLGFFSCNRVLSATSLPSPTKRQEAYQDELLAPLLPG